MKNDLFTFDDTTHTYWLNGKRLTGTTTVLGVLSKDALIPWAARMAVERVEVELDAWKLPDFPVEVLRKVLVEAKVAHTKKKDDAADHGTNAHALVELYIKECIAKENGEPYQHLEASPIKKFTDWALEHVDHFLFAERRMYDAAPEHWFAGTADFAYVGKDGLRYMADFKTSSGIYGISYFLQVAAYRYLAELLGETYDAMIIVRLGKDGKFETQSTREYSLFREAFFHCLALYRAQAKYSMFIEKGECTRAKEGKVGIRKTKSKTK